VSEEKLIERELRLESVRAVRLGHGANCSSIGSVVDTLFVSAVIGGAVLAAVIAAMKKEPITVVGPPAPHPRDLVDRGADDDEGSR
jgi:hypothetical protein